MVLRGVVSLLNFGRRDADAGLLPVGLPPLPGGGEQFVERGRLIVVETDEERELPRTGFEHVLSVARQKPGGDIRVEGDGAAEELLTVDLIADGSAGVRFDPGAAGREKVAELAGGGERGVDFPADGEDIPFEMAEDGAVDPGAVAVGAGAADDAVPVVERLFPGGQFAQSGHVVQEVSEGDQLAALGVVAESRPPDAGLDDAVSALVLVLESFVVDQDGEIPVADCRGGAPPGGGGEVGCCKFHI